MISLNYTYLPRPCNWRCVSIKEELLWVSSGGRFLARWLKEHLGSRGAWKNVLGKDPPWKGLGVDGPSFSGGLKDLAARFERGGAERSCYLLAWISGVLCFVYELRLERETATRVVYAAVDPSLPQARQAQSPAVNSGATHWIRALSSYDV